MFKKILVPTDGSPHAEKAERLGADLAQRYGAELVYLSVVVGGPLSAAARQLAVDKGLDITGLAPPPDPSLLVPEAGPVMPAAEHTLAASRIQAELAEALVADAEARAARYGLTKVKGMTRSGNAAEVILETARAVGADAIVMGSRGLGGLKGLLAGSVSQKVGQLADCTCVSVK